MRKIELEIFRLDELTEEVKEKAIQRVREKMESSNMGWDFINWSFDDCSIFEPKHQEMAALLGEDYVGKNNGQFMLKNTRGEHTLSFSHGIIQCAESIEITNMEYFTKWSGLDKLEHIKPGEDFEVEFFNCDETGKTQIDFYFHNYLEVKKISPKDQKILDAAKVKFHEHMYYVLRLIESGVDYRWSDEGIEEDILSNEHYEFTADGNIFKLEF